MKNAIVLCSGGLDSVVVSHYVKKKLKYGKFIFLFFDYGQRTLNEERKCVKNCARLLNGEFMEIKLKWLREISKSLITGNKKIDEVKIKDLKISKGESDKYYVPSRNAIFINYSIALSESKYLIDKEVFDIFVGFCNEGVESYPDTTVEFVDEMNKLMKLNKLKGKVIAPLINKQKEDVVDIGGKLGVDFRDTFSCYAGNKVHCGVCLACRFRQEAFYWANVKDPSKYNKKMEDFRVA
ncbi:hypothetical protein CMI38_01950 [Candidatus Pacearchaeota archaeon]|jgi:7-cyano-7-deazaguanine synthase|nr:hypothetical protein [Candidatus Pacearchaeota archaeon]|tara:strand:+ start:1918 stop:2631 length:714 start_codon:yes stop_codon:yes gene_type:complete